jgi:hypothetical protein
VRESKGSVAEGDIFEGGTAAEKQQQLHAALALFSGEDKS